MKFKYNIAPLASGGFYTRAVRGTQADQTAITAHVAAAASITPAQVELAITSFFDRLIACSGGCEWSPELYGCVSFRPTSGGSKPLPTDFHDADDINADIAISLSADKIRAWRATLELESLGEVGKITPLIDSIINQATNAVDTYVPGSLIQLRGDNLRLNQTDLTQGVFFKAGAAAEVRATVYGTMDPGSISVLVPATLSGPLTVRVAAFINGSVRSYTYQNLITE